MRRAAPAFCPGAPPAGLTCASRGAFVCGQPRRAGGWSDAAAEAVAPRGRRVRATQAQPQESAPVVCFNDSGKWRDDGFEFEEEDGFESVVLRDAQTRRTLPCIVEKEVEVEGKSYLVCCPHHDVVSIAYEENDELVCIEDEEHVDKLFDTASAVLAEQHWKLQRSAFVLTADDTDATVMDSMGYEDDEFDDDDDAYDYDDEFDDDIDGDDIDDEEDSGLGSMDVEVISEFCHDNKYYLVVRPEGPILLVARRTPDGVIVPDDDELDRVTPLIENKLEALEEV